MIHFNIRDYGAHNWIEKKQGLINKQKTKEKIKSFYEVKGKYNFKLNWRLKRDLDILIDDLEQNDDALIIIVASEGAGKTVIESQIAYYISTKTKVELNVNDVHFEGQGYMDKALSSPKYNVNCLDESRRALNKMRAISGSNVDFNNFLSECRSNNQVHIIVLPAFTDLEQYVAIHRVKMLISVDKKRDKETKRLIRGNFNVWNTKSKNLLKKAWDGKYKEFPRNMLKYKGKFDNVLCFNEKEYEKKKEDAKKERYMTKKEDVTKNKVDKFTQLIIDKKKEGLSMDKIALITNVSKMTVKRIIDKNKKNCNK